MEGNFYLGSYLDPIAKVWPNTPPVLDAKQVKIWIKKKNNKKIKK